MTNATGISVLPPKDASDHDWLADLWQSEWGGSTMVSRGRVHHIADVLSLIAWHNGQRVGAATYVVTADNCELLSINATLSGLGVGSSLLASVEEAARGSACTNVWLITSNDNLYALRFYQKRGYRITRVYPGAIDEARKQKPSIPLIGDDGIPVHDEIELTKWLVDDKP